MDAWIISKGGIGLTVLGIGMNGHLGFNEPGVEIKNKCIIVDLDKKTLNVGRKYFNGANCPDKGITVGLGYLLNAENVILLAENEKKSGIVREALEGEVTLMNPASLLQTHKQ